MIDQHLTKVLTNWTDAEWAEAEAIEKELYVRLQEGLTEAAAFTFIQAVMVLRRQSKSVTIGGAFDAALQLGVGELVIRAYPEVARKAKLARKAELAGRGKLSGRGVR